jgi:uncharacterized protein YceK
MAALTAALTAAPEADQSVQQPLQGAAEVAAPTELTVATTATAMGGMTSCGSVRRWTDGAPGRPRSEAGRSASARRQSWATRRAAAAAGAPTERRGGPAGAPAAHRGAPRGAGGCRGAPA